MPGNDTTPYSGVLNRATIKMYQLSRKRRVSEMRVSEIYAKLALYESVKEATTVLELSFWKAKIDMNVAGKAAARGLDPTTKRTADQDTA